MTPEEKYQLSISDVTQLKMQVDKLSGVVGEMKVKFDDMPDIEAKLEKFYGDINEIRIDVNKIVSALTGDTYNPEGMVSRVKKIQDYYEETAKQITDIKFQIKNKNIHVNLIIGFVVFVASMVARTVWEYFFKKSAP